MTSGLLHGRARGIGRLLLCGALLCVLPSTRPVLAGETAPLFRFVQISDQHFVDSSRLDAYRGGKIGGASRRFERIPEMIGRLAARANEIGAAFVLMTGDVIENPNHAKEAVPEFVAAHRTLAAPFFIVPGNHDHGIGRFLPPGRGGGDLSFTAGGIVFAGVRTYDTQCSALVDLMPRESVEAAAAVLAAAPDSPAVVFCHAPLGSGREIPDWAPPRNAAQARQVFERAGNVVLVLSGHIHAFTRTSAGGIAYVTAPGFVEAPDFPFVVWSVFPDRFRGEVLSAATFAKLGETEIPIPGRFRARIGPAAGGPIRAAAPPPGGDAVLARWFGPGWSHYPGGTPVALPRETVVLPRGSGGWRMIAAPAGKEPAKDARGKAWTENGYDEAGWAEAALPASFGYRRNAAAAATVASRLPETNKTYCFRRTFTLDAAPPAGAKAMFRAASDKSAAAWLNGMPLDRDELLHWADYWNRHVVFDASRLRRGENTLAVSLSAPASSHAFLDLEISLDVSP